MYQAFITLNLVLLTIFFIFSGQLVCLFSKKIPEIPLQKLTLAEKASPIFSLVPLQALELEAKPYYLFLPELKDNFQFLGQSLRPDEKEKVLFLKINGSNEIIPAKEQEHLYFTFNRSNLDSRYQFSKKETPLYLKLRLQNDNSVEVSVFLKESTAAEMQQQFILPLKSYTEAWFLNDLKVDQSLFVRERAKFCGKDLFLEMHGGEEFAFENGRMRIDFEQQEPYSLFIKENDLLIFENNRWVNNEIAKVETKGRAVMEVKSIDEHFIHFEIFSPLGDQKLPLKIIKSPKQSNCYPQIVTSQIHFLQAKTWSQFVVDLQGERKILRRGDWLIYIDHKWQLVDTSDLIDQYVASKLIAPLFVIDELQKQKSQKIITGHLFSPSRTEMVLIELEQQSDRIANNFNKIKKPEEPS